MSPTLEWFRTEVDGRPACYGAGGDGPAVVFAHSFGLSGRAYRSSLAALAARGLRVYAPALPGCDGTARLPTHEATLPAFARWLDAFCDTVIGDEPLAIIGHSFGGAVAAQTAHDYPTRSRGVMLVNAVGGAWRMRGTRVHAMANRPLWDWTLHVGHDMFPFPRVVQVLPRILESAVPNVVRNPLALWRASEVARTCDLTAELRVLARRDAPVVVVWSAGDQLIPRASFESMCDALGEPLAITVPGGHSWPIADPRRFVEVVAGMLPVVLAAGDDQLVV